MSDGSQEQRQLVVPNGIMILVEHVRNDDQYQQFLIEIEPQLYDFNSHTQTNVEREIQEYREEQEIASQIQDNRATSEIVEEKEEENDGPIDYLDDYNLMNTRITIDLP
ncbi:unnamed protein product [Rotaria sp. Silwood2]|nr:unnamed protein product [Rotaria sp. Silwood2]